MEHDDSVEPEAAEPQRRTLTLEMPVDVRNFFLSVIAMLAIVAFLWFARDFLIPIVLAVIISYALDPLVTALARLRIPRAAGAAVLLAAIVGGGGWGLYRLQDQAISVVEKLPEAAQKLRRTLRPGRGSETGAIEKMQKAATEIEKTADAVAGSSQPAPGVMRVQVEEPAFRAQEYLWWGGAGILSIAGQLLMILLLAYFMLASGDLYRRKLVRLTGPRLSRQKITVQILDEINGQVERFLLVLVSTNVVVGVATWLALKWLGLGQAAVWGLAAGVFNTIPYFGAVVVAIGLAVIAFLQFGTLEMAAATAGASLVITSVEGFLLTPFLVGRAAQMNQVAVFIGLIFWAWLWGLPGMLLAVPMLMMCKTVCDHVEGLRPIGELLGAGRQSGSVDPS